MGKKLIFLDLDGTALTDDKKLSAGNRKAIDEAMAAGHKIVVTTGRPLASARKQAERHGLAGPGSYIVAFNGGLIYVNGPTNGGNGALDSGTESGGKLTVNGGTLIALGASGMAESFGDGSQQSSVAFTSNETWQAGDVLEIRTASEGGEMSDSVLADTDAADQTDQVNVGSKDGTAIFSCTAVKSGNSVVFTSGELKTGETYVLYLNGEEAASGTAAADTSGDAGGFDAPGGPGAAGV